MEEHRVYFLFDAISGPLRNLVSVLLVGAGFLFQLGSRNILAGLPFIIGCIALNFMKSVSIKRVSPTDFTWQEVTPKKIEQVYTLITRIKKFRSKDVGCLVVFFIVVIFSVFFGIPFLSELSSSSFPIIAALFNAFVLFAGLMIGGRRSAWMPPGLDIKVDIVRRLLNHDYVRKDPTIQVHPYLEIGTTQQGGVPNDARILIKFKDAPEDFIGVQGQISINAVRSQQYPYFYVVLLAKPEFKLFEKFGKPSLDNLVVEFKRTAEVDVIVIRQYTTQTSGYHTDADVQDHILKTALQLTKKVI